MVDVLLNLFQIEDFLLSQLNNIPPVSESLAARVFYLDSISILSRYLDCLGTGFMLIIMG